VSRAARIAGRSGRHGRPSALRAAIQERLEEMRFRHGVLLMVTAAVVVVAAVAAVATALSGGTGGRSPRAGDPPMADSSDSQASSATPDYPSPEPRQAARRPRTAASTMVGSAAPSPTSRPTTDSPSPAGVPDWWQRTSDPRHRDRYPHWRRSDPPPWWRHH
jgi:cytoskeletal protein RodZ